MAAVLLRTFRPDASTEDKTDDVCGDKVDDGTSNREELAGEPEDCDLSNVRTLSSLFSSRPMRLQTRLVVPIETSGQEGILDYIAFGSLHLRTVRSRGSHLNCSRTHLISVRNFYSQAHKPSVRLR
jgi:hypothetical protein